MKNLVSILVILCFSCKKTEVPNLYKLGTISALINGNTWITTKNFDIGVYQSSALSGEKCNANVNELIISIYNEFKDRRETLGISNFPLEIGKINNIIDGSNMKCGSKNVGAKYFLIGDDGDAIVGIYGIKESTSNYIKINYIDRTKKVIEGEFELTFVRERGVQNARDIIEFKNGQFKSYYDF